MSPLCGTMHAHHVIYRSHGGCDDDENLAVLCATHHQQGIHAGRLRCRGSAGGFLRWEFGVAAGGPPLLTAVEDVLLGDGSGPREGPGSRSAARPRATMTGAEFP